MGKRLQLKANTCMYICFGFENLIFTNSRSGQADAAGGDVNENGVFDSKQDDSVLIVLTGILRIVPKLASF